NRDVDAPMRAPVIMAVDVKRHFTARAQTHEAAAAPDAADLAHDLLDVGHCEKLRRGSHLAVEIVGWPPAGRHQPDGFIAFEARWVRNPRGFWKGADLALQRRRIELQRQLQERVGETHGRGLAGIIAAFGPRINRRRRNAKNEMAGSLLEATLEMPEAQ